MSATKIEWVRNPDGTPGQTVNPIRFRNKETGKIGHYCEKVSAGCTNCYSSRMQKPYLSGLEFIAENKGKGELFFDETVLQKVLRMRKPTSFFWCDMTDLFGRWVPDEWIDRCFATAALTPQHRHLFLTKRTERMRERVTSAAERIGRLIVSRQAQLISGWAERVSGSYVAHSAWWPLPNVWLGISIEDRSQLHRIDYLRETPAALRFLSLEPLLEDLGELDLRGIGWCIAGSESGPNARPCKERWIRSIKDQCVAVGIPFFYKQRIVNGKKLSLPELDGERWTQFPQITA